MQRVFLAVEQGGYCAQRRKHVAVSSTVEEARAGCQQWHPEPTGAPCAVFEVLSSSQFSVFQTPRGSVRLNCKHVPASFLKRVG
jgi:hypothetical protein